MAHFDLQTEGFGDLKNVTWIRHYRMLRRDTGEYEFEHGAGSGPISLMIAERRALAPVGVS